MSEQSSSKQLSRGILFLFTLLLSSFVGNSNAFSLNAGTKLVGASRVHSHQGISFMKESRGSSTKLFNKPLLKSVSIDSDNSEFENDFCTDIIPTWIKNNKSKILSSVAVVAVAALVNPSISYASTTTLADAASSSVLLEKFVDSGFYQAFSLVFLSEIGDKTFFIAGLLAMKTSKFVSFVGAIGALAVMTVISVLLGQIFHAVPAGLTQGLPLDDIAAVLAFAFFGVKTLKEAYDLDEGESIMDEEFEDAQEAVDGSQTVKQVTPWGQIVSTFGLVFAAEFGDRSFLSTIALSAAQNPVSVCFGAIAAHAIATGIAVAGGSYMAKNISEKVIGYVGGGLFIVFAITTALGIF
jgi:putative Ca2+/H+ antiporter (TMEM165/GDT1 family)